MKKKYTLGVIGGGKMAEAIVRGAIAKKFLCADQIIVGEPNADRAKVFSSLGVSVAENRAVAADCAYLLVAVKPQTFADAARDFQEKEIPAVLSIMAGMTKKAIKSVLGAGTTVARAMPNLPCSVGEGMVALDASDCSEEEKQFAVKLFSSTGKVTQVKEAQLNAVTGVSGSGPAYVFLFLRALTEAGKEQGLCEEQAYALALQTLKGGLALAEASPQTPLSELIASVSSKGGTTVAALESFSRDDWAGSVSRAGAAAVKRAEELSL